MKQGFLGLKERGRNHRKKHFYGNNLISAYASDVSDGTNVPVQGLSRLTGSDQPLERSKTTLY